MSVVRRYLLAFDSTLAMLFFFLLAWSLPPQIPAALAKDLFAAGMSVLAITFSVFFAALAVIISGSDNGFVEFLEEDGSYTKITKTFRFTLEVIFLALIASILGFGLASAQIANDCIDQSKWFLTFFASLFLYSLLAALGVARDSITYAKYRTEYLAATGRCAGDKSLRGNDQGSKKASSSIDRT